MLQEVIRRATSERTPLMGESSASSEHQAIGFMGALRIPGVIEFSLTLFFAKLVSYTFLYWLPLYVNKSSKFFLSVFQDILDQQIF